MRGKKKVRHTQKKRLHTYIAPHRAMPHIKKEACIHAEREWTDLAGKKETKGKRGKKMKMHDVDDDGGVVNH